MSEPWGEATRFLRALDTNPGAHFTFQTFDDTKLHRELARIFHGTLEEHYSTLCMLSHAGAGIFVTLNETDGLGRQSHNVTRVRGLFVDCDSAPIEPIVQSLKPHIHTETSPGRYHVIWLVDDCPLEQFSLLQKAIARRFGTDPNVFDTPRVVRVPGFPHRKNPAAPFRSRLVQTWDGPPYAVAKLVSALGLEVVEADPSGRSDERAARRAHRWFGEGERNARLTSLAGSFRRQGMSELEILAAIRSVNAERCSPPLADSELVRIAKSVGRYAPHESGVLSHDSADEPQWDDPHPWPTMAPAAFHGLAGDIVEAVDPHTEADPVGVLLTVLVAFGNAVGPEPHVVADGDNRHPARLFAALVGGTSTGGKGTALAIARQVLRAANDQWWRGTYVNGFVSGEAIIARLSGAHGAAGDPVEKRVFIVEPELARLLTVNGRDGSTSSAILRGAWDDGRLERVTALKSMLAEGVHPSLLGHITPEELRSKLSADEIANGFANRFLFACVRRSKKLPRPEPLGSALLETLATRLRSQIEVGSSRRRMSRSPEADALWERLYLAEPDREGLVGKITVRWAPQKLRLSLIYALLDGAEVIRPEHVMAAEAVWGYCVASAEHIFGGMQGDDVADKILEAVRDAYPDGLEREAVRSIFSRHVSSARLSECLTTLEKRGLVRRVRIHSIGKDGRQGRPKEMTYAVPRCAKSA